MAESSVVGILQLQEKSNKVKQAPSAMIILVTVDCGNFVLICEFGFTNHTTEPSVVSLSQLIYKE